MQEIDIQGYRIERELGRGSMATVYLAIQLLLEREVALKVMAPSLVADPSFSERFLREAKTIARLHHPHIISIHEIGSCKNLYYMALEYAAAGNLADRIRQTVGPERRLDWICQVAGALGHAHSHGVVHRDVKLGNILFRDDNLVLLSDFGIAKAVASGTQMTALGWTVGTPTYMSPEQATGKKVTPQSDLYSLGICTFELLTGKRPFESEDPFALAFMHMHQPVPALPSEYRELQPIIDRLLAKAPEDRYPSADELIHAIRSVLNGGGLGAVGPQSSSAAADSGTADDLGTVVADMGSRSATKPASPIPGRRLLVAGTMLGLAVLGLVAIAVFQLPGGSSPLPATVRLPADFIDRELASLRGVSQAFEDIRRMAPESEIVAAQEQEMVQRHVDLARKALAYGYRDRATEVATEGLELLPGNPELEDLREQLRASGSRQSSTPEAQATADQLYTQAERQLRAGQYTLPTGSSALDLYRRILQLEPLDARASRRLAEMADYFAQSARQQLEDDQLAQAVAAVEQGLLVDPSHSTLLSLRREVQQRLERARRDSSS